MAKQVTNLQIETARRELDKAVAAVVDAWRVGNPHPSWEAEEQWQRANPSPKRQHGRKEEEVRAAIRASADDLMLRIMLGTIPSEEIYTELKQVLDQLHEKKMAHIKACEHG